MNWMDRTRWFPLGLALSVSALALPAFAALGGDAASVQADASNMKAQLRSTQKQAYTMHELQTAGGASVREYVSPAGKVFGVAWSGPVIPDLQQLLGSYYERFSAAAKNRHGVRGPLSIQQQDLVLFSGGHMRAYTGKAYIPQMLPEGVHADAIQ
jgi:hypothetical protein